MKATKMYNKFVKIKCPYCESAVKVDFNFAKENGRVFCGTCCKSFDVEIDDTEEE
jgi:transcription elongation factor Elf1